MKQYCRYCANCFYGDFVYCWEHKKEMSESTAKAVNKCKDFIFNPIDVLGGDLNKKYKPRKEKVNENQPTLFD